MKKFKTSNNKSKIKILILLTIFIILFILISLTQLKHSQKNIINILLNDSIKRENDFSLRFLTANLDNLINNYYFNKEEVISKISPTVYLYNTHDDEKYSDNTTIYDATKLLNSNLKKLGINVIQEELKPSDFLITGLSNYAITKTFVENAKANNKNISYYIDIHRDSVDNTTITINNKKYAKIMFVLGLENKNYEKNKLVMKKMNDYLNKYYPGISRGIYEKKGSGVNGIYNQDIDENVILIEIGGIKNNLEEVNNSTEIISLMLYYMLGD